MNRSRKVCIFAILLLCWSPSATWAGEWLGGKGATFVIKTVNPKGSALNGPEIKVTAETMPDTIFLVGRIRRERTQPGTTAATVSDLRPGVRIRAHGGGSTSPVGFIADRIVILTR